MVNFDINKTCKLNGCSYKHWAKGFCRNHYERNKKYGSPYYKKTRKVKPIEFYVNKNGCFVVTSHAKANGYPILNIEGTTVNVHRKIYKELFGGIKKGLVIRHKCDNRSCINPEHLEPGTYQDNMDDMAERKRSLHGERNHFAKLDNRKVLEIRSLIGSMTYEEIANMYGVKKGTIYRIAKRITWKHV